MCARLLKSPDIGLIGAGTSPPSWRCSNHVKWTFKYWPPFTFVVYILRKSEVNGPCSYIKWKSPPWIRFLCISGVPFTFSVYFVFYDCGWFTGWSVHHPPAHFLHSTDFYKNTFYMQLWYHFNKTRNAIWLASAASLNGAHHFFSFVFFRCTMSFTSSFGFAFPISMQKSTNQIATFPPTMFAWKQDPTFAFFFLFSGNLITVVG